MKKSFLVFSILLGSLLTGAKTLETNVDQRNCLREGGELRALSWTRPKAGTQEFCYFFGDQGMDSRSLRLGKFNTMGPEANRVYRATLDYTVEACIRSHGQPVLATDQDFKNLLICRFWDGSAIDHRTLENGVRSPWNRELNRALGIF
jgi:hypothetical protein